MRQGAQADTRPRGAHAPALEQLAPQQRFASSWPQQEIVALTHEQSARKLRMLRAHASQAQVLAPFAVDAERFRIAPHYDFSRLPNAARLLYERHDLGMSGVRWTALARRALTRNVAKR